VLHITNECILLYIMDGRNGACFGVFIVGLERVINCWSDGMDASLRMCIAKEFLENIPRRAPCS
jgi:hypothetical protein